MHPYIHFSQPYSGGVSAKRVAITLYDRSTLHGAKNKKERHLRGRVPSTFDFRSLHQSPNLLHLLVAQLKQRRGRIFVHFGGRLRTRDGDDLRSLRQQPRKSDLCRGASMGIGHVFQSLHQIQDLGEVFLRVLGQHAAQVTLRDVCVRLELAGQNTAPNRAVGHDSHTQLAAGFQDLRGR